MLGIDDLIEAIGAAEQFDGAHPDLREYWAKRRDVLLHELGLEVPQRGDRRGVGRRDLFDVARRASELGYGSRSSAVSPFASYLETSAEINALWESYADELRDVGDRVRAVNHRIALAVLERLDPALPARTCSLDVLTAAGLDPHPPDEYDFE